MVDWLLRVVLRLWCLVNWLLRLVLWLLGLVVWLLSLVAWGVIAAIATCGDDSGAENVLVGATDCRDAMLDLQCGSASKDLDEVDHFDCLFWFFFCGF